MGAWVSKYKYGLIAAVLLTVLVEMRVQKVSTEAFLGALVFGVFFCGPDLFFRLLYACQPKPPRS